MAFMVLENEFEESSTTTAPTAMMTRESPSAGHLVRACGGDLLGRVILLHWQLRSGANWRWGFGRFGIKLLMVENANNANVEAV